MEKAHLVGLQVASIGDGELAWKESYGVKDFRSGEPVKDSTLFMIASCFKLVTALAIMKLNDQGILDLDDNVSDHLPFVVRNPHHPEQRISVRMLLTHTFSLRDNWDILSPLYTLPEGGDSPLELGDYVRAYFVQGEKYYRMDQNFANKQPASSYAYCNMGYVLPIHMRYPPLKKDSGEVTVLNHYGYPDFPG